MLNRIIAFAGPKGCGKSTAAQHLINHHGFVRFSFADPIRDMLMSIGVTREELSDRVLKEQPCATLMGKSPREVMQKLGTEFGREMVHSDLWVTIARRRLDKAREAGASVVLDDCRFDNEAETWRQVGGTVIEITRPGQAYSDSHASEAGLSRHLINISITNDHTTDKLLKDVEYVLNLS